MRQWPAVTLAGLMVLATLTGCDGEYRVAVENHQSRDLRVSIASVDYGWVKSCSVRTITFHAPPYGETLEVRVADAQGRATYDLRPGVERSRGFAEVSAAIPERVAGECRAIVEEPTVAPSATWGTMSNE